MPAAFQTACEAFTVKLAKLGKGLRWDLCSMFPCSPLWRANMQTRDMGEQASLFFVLFFFLVGARDLFAERVGSEKKREV